MRGLPPVTIRTAERRFRSGPNLLSDLKILAVDGLAPKWFSSSTTQDSMGIEWMTVIYQRLDEPLAMCVALSIFKPPGGALVGRRLVPREPPVIRPGAPAFPAPENRNAPRRNDPARPRGWLYR